MKADPNIISKPKPEPKSKPHRLPEEPQWRGHYNAILNGLFSSCYGPIDWDAPPPPEELADRAAQLVAIAFHAACQAHCHAFISDPNPEVEIKHFNEIISGEAE